MPNPVTPPLKPVDNVSAPLSRGLANVLTPVANERLVQVDGQMGVFTPVTQPATGPSDPKSDANLQAIIATLRAEITRLNEQNQNLQAQLDKLKAAASTPDDLAAALQHSLDRLQGTLAAGTNPVSGFAVREFRLETNVHVAVSPLGVLEYRFPQLDEQIEPTSLSRLSLQLAPIPRATGVNSFTGTDFQPRTNIAEIGELTADQQSALHAKGIDTVEDFLAAGTRARSSVELASILKVDRAKLSVWTAMAWLLTIKGMTGARASILIAAGIDSLDKIAALDPVALLKRFNDQRNKDPRSTVPLLDEAEASAWIRASRAFRGHAPA